MYLYVYDLFLQDRKYAAVLARIEGRVLELGIQGKTERLTVLKQLKEIIEDGIRQGAKTVVAVGNDATIREVIRLTAKHNVTLGFIPLGEPAHIASFLGIPTGEAACDILSARIIERIDLGMINGQYFFSSIDLPGAAVTLECDGKYHVTSTAAESRVSIRNVGDLGGEQLSYSHPQDGLLEAVVQGAAPSRFSFFSRGASKPSVFPIKRMRVTATATEAVSVVADGHFVVKTPLTVEIAPRKLSLIVGKERRF